MTLKIRVNPHNPRQGGTTPGRGAWVAKRAIREYPTGTLFTLIPYGHHVHANTLRV